MKKQLKFYKYLIIAIVLMIIATVLEKNALQPTDYQVNTEEFSATLFNKEERIDTLLNEVYNRLKPNIKEQSHQIFETLWDFDLKKLKEDGYIFLVYINDSLKFWSDNSLDVSQRYSESGLNNLVLNLNNAWYYVRSIHDKNLEIIGLVELRKDFSFQNEYLVNEFHRDFKIPNSIEISKVPLSYSYDIYNKEEVFLFSLVPTNQIFSQNYDWGYVGSLYFLGIAFLFVFFNIWFRQITINQSNPVPKIIMLLLFLVFIRYLMLEFKYPLQIYSLPFFEPGYFAVSYLFPSLGDFLINAFFILIFTRSLFFIFRAGIVVRFFKNKPDVIKYVFSILLLVIVVFYFNYLIQLLESLVINSSLPIEAHKVLELNLFSLIAYSIFGLLFAALIIAVDRAVFILKQLFVAKKFFIVSGSVLLLYSIAGVYFEFVLIKGSLAYFLVLYASISYIYLKRRKYHYSLYIFLIILGSVYITLFVNDTIKSKDYDKSNVLISRLVNERDRVAEHLLISMEENLKKDTVLKGSVINQGPDQLEQIHSRLKKQYFGGYLLKYDLDFGVCCNCENYEKRGLQNCDSYYGDIIDEFGRQIGSTNFYYLDNLNGRVSYQGAVSFTNSSNESFNLYLLLDSKLMTREVGYPDLLIEGKVNKKEPFSGYSYAKYQKGKLVTRSGSFPYDLNEKMFRKDSIEQYVIGTNEYEHYVKASGENLIVLTKARVKGFDLVIAFSYVFVFFNILLILTLSINNVTRVLRLVKLNFENKLLLAMLFVLILSFAMVTAGTVYYNSSQFEQKHNTNISERLESVLKNLEMEEDKGFLTDSLLVASNQLNLNELLKKLASIYYTDINLYNKDGQLIASSRPEIFSRGLIGSLMDSEAFRQMNVNEKIRFIQNEKIGSLQYSSAYALFRNIGIHNSVFINLPYFTKPSELRQEVSNLVVAIINLYVVLFIVVALISFLMANKITQPLRMLQMKFQNIELGKQSEQIAYDKKDEVGALVQEYNRMVVKLAESIELLAKTERESAWREMAKQIAHEIKNPLTPMKLSVQFLQRAWLNKDEKFETKLNKSTQTLIDQINTLSNIATEFSNFAKMPKPKQEVVDLVVRIGHTIELFGTTENLTIDTNIEDFDKLIIIADHEHISRVFTNLVKNAIQAIPVDQEGHIRIMAESDTQNVLIKVIDNGSGITDEQKEKLFIPSFTTKSSGMGMGLPIVKDIIESANGKIWFETELGKGTTFLVKFPLASDHEIREFVDEDEGN